MLFKDLRCSKFSEILYFCPVHSSMLVFVVLGCLFANMGRANGSGYGSGGYGGGYSGGYGGNYGTGSGYGGGYGMGSGYGESYGMGSGNNYNAGGYGTNYGPSYGGNMAYGNSGSGYNAGYGSGYNSAYSGGYMPMKPYGNQFRAIIELNTNFFKLAFQVCTELRLKTLLERRIANHKNQQMRHPDP